MKEFHSPFIGLMGNNIKIAWRNLSRNKFFSFINIAGLAVGLTCCMLIVLYLHYESNYDSYQKNAANLYQVETVFLKKGERPDVWADTPAPVADAMKAEFPDVLQSTKLLGLFQDDKTLLQVTAGRGEKRSFLEDKGYLTDGSFFKMFSYNFIEGNPDHTLNAPYTIVISEDIASKLFGDQPALNKIVHVNSNTNGEHDYVVTGVFKPGDRPSHIDARFFISFTGGSMEPFIKAHATDFVTNNMFYTYVLLRPGTDPAKINAGFPAFLKKYAEAALKIRGLGKEQFLLPVKELHLRSDITGNVTPAGSKTYLYILGCIALFILLIACINFMNLSTAQSSKRSSEVGVRKVLGAEKASLVRQFLGESVLLTLLAFLLALLLIYLLLPVFNHIAGRNITFTFAGDIDMLVTFMVIAMITGLIAGSYPAFYLSSFNPVKVLKGRLTSSFAVASIRKALVVFQFTISVVLIIASVVIARQMRFLRNADLGFVKDEQLVIPLSSKNAKAAYAALKIDLRTNSNVVSVGASFYYPGIANPSDDQFYKEGQSMTESKRARINFVDADFMKTLNLKAAAGRLFSEEFKADTGYRIIVNETAVKQIGLGSPQQAIGQKIFLNYQGKPFGFEIIGVVKDFHFEDLHSPVEPFAFQLLKNPTAFNYAIVHIKAGAVKQVVNTAGELWRKYDANEPFQYSFLDEDFQKNYKADDQLASIVSYFTIVAIVISCLGLFGLAAFSTEQRTKEIGVRKVLGASVTAIVSLLSVDFVRLVLISVVIASPVAWLIMNKWLQGFASRQPISWSVFAITAVLAIMIALLTISYQTIRAALANPVKSLRSE